ncbi:MAG: hypothetical protein IJ506_05230 [Clostridia bacterium]|nr:hypothetical protein [Clostridia bacterium]
MALKGKLILLLTGLTAFACGVGTSLFNVRAEEGELSAVDYRQTYVLGETVEIADATITYGGTEYPATANVIFPSGTVYSLDSVTLSESGVYTVEYRASVNGKLLIETVDFSVSDELFSVEGTGEFSYGKNAYLGEMNGINVSLSSGAVLRYNKVVDVSDNMQGVAPIVRLYCTPQIKGEREVENVRITLTDAYDPENFVEVLYKADSVDQYTYITANANGQTPSGLEARASLGSSGIEYDGGIWRLFQGQMYGFNGRSSFSGNVPTGLTMEENYFELNMDYETKRLYVQRAVVDPKRNLLIDLDEPTFFGENLWEGFTTGEVIVTIQGLAYNSGNFNFFISQMDGHDLAASSVSNGTPPSISVDFGAYEENDLPNVIVNHAAKVYPATANDDLEGAIECSAKVYYNYDNSSRSLVNVKNGEFTPTRSGIYTIEYKAADSFGNVTVKTVDITAIAREQIEYELSAHETVFSVGGEITVASANVLNSLTGYTIDVKARLKDSDVVYDISEKTLKFTPVYAGVYTIEYIYSDYVETKTFSYDITVNAADKPVFFADAVVPRYFIKNCTYYIPDYYAYDYSDGFSELKADIYVSVDGAEPYLLSGNSVTVNAESTLDIIYRAGNAEKVYNGKVVDTNYGEQGKVKFAEYLQGSAFTATEDVDNIAYATDASKATDGVAALELINSAYVNVFNVEFTVADKEFETVSLILTADNDRSKKIVIQYTKNDLGTTDVTVTYGDATVKGVSTSSFESGNVFQCSVYNNDLVVNGSDISIPLEQAFEGFGKKFFVDIELSGITGNASIKIRKLMNQLLSNSTLDNVLPVLIYTPLRDDYKLGDTIEISAFDYYDFVDPSPSFKYSFRSDEGYMTSAEGVLLNGSENDYRTAYTVAVTDYGTVRLSFTLNDYSVWSDNIGGFVVPILDSVPPTITLDVKKTAYKTGKITVADYVTTDDSGEKVAVDIMVIDADGVITVLDGKTFDAPKKGAYTVLYRAADSVGNVTFAQYSITVK